MRHSRLTILLAMVFCVFVKAQNKQILYDFNEIPQSVMVNPGVESDFKWYAGVPLLSGISGYAGSSGVSVNDIFANDGLDINDKIRNRMVDGLSTKDEFSGTFQLEFLNIGYRSQNPKVFYSFGAYLDIDNIIYWPKDYAHLAFEGNADQIGREYDLGDLKARGSMVNVIHFGINKKINRNLTIGARGKIYSGIVDYSSSTNNGYFINTEGANNRIRTTLSADLELKTSGLDAIGDADNTASAFIKRAAFGGDLGLGADFGFTYHFDEQTVLTASLLDLGFIYHSSDTKRYSLDGQASVEGIEFDVLEQFANLNRDFWQDLVDDVEELIPFETNSNGYISFRPTKLYASIRHDFGEPIGGSENCDCGITASQNSLRTRYRNSYGAQLYAINRPRGLQTAITAFYQRRVGNIMALKATYTADKFSYTNLGLGLNLQAGPVNLYVMADNLLSYQNIAASNYASFQLGLNIISWEK